MNFTGQLGTKDSMPGNIALGTVPPSGGGPGGVAPLASAAISIPNASGTVSVPRGS